MHKYCAGISFVFMFFLLSCSSKTGIIIPGQVKDIFFVLPDNIEAGDYCFDFENGAKADYPLCFCLHTKNNFPPDCNGNITYVSHNFREESAVPATIGNGYCRQQPLKTGMYATTISIASDYNYARMKDSVFIGVILPGNVDNGKIISIKLNIYKRDRDNSSLTKHGSIEKNFLVEHAKSKA